MTDLPAIVDADTGFGEPMNVARTVQELEDAGLAGCHIEDQFNPKRCGHLDGKNVVDEDTAIKRIRAAADARRDPNFLIMARTDIRAVDGLDAAIDRAKALVDAGADAIFPEAMRTSSEFAGHPRRRRRADPGQHDRVRQERAVHRATSCADVGVNMVIYPVTLLRIAMGAAERALDTINGRGHPAGTGRRDAAPARDCTTSSTTRPTTTSTPASSTSRSRPATPHQHPHEPRQRGDGATHDQHDRAEIKKGLAGVVVDYTAVSKVNPDTNSLLYRGYPVQELAAELQLRGGRVPAVERRAARRRSSWREFTAAERAGRALDPVVKQVDRRCCRSTRTRWTSAAPRSA